MSDPDHWKGVLAVVILRALSRLPFSLLQFFGRCLGVCSYVLNGRTRKVVEANLRHCFPHWTVQECDQHTRRVLQESGKTLFEIAALWNWPPDKTRSLIVSVEGEALLKQALAAKQGVILLAPHLGNWELAGVYLAQQGPITCLYSPAKLPELDRFMRDGRQRNGTKLAPANAQGVRMLLKALRQGEMVGILPDQVPDEGNGVFAPFFGRPAYTMTLLAALASKTGAQVLATYARRRNDGTGFDMVLSRVDEGFDGSDAQQAATVLNQTVEACVQQALDQYQWEYKRFRERPPGERKIY